MTLLHDKGSSIVAENTSSLNFLDALRGTISSTPTSGAFDIRPIETQQAHNPSIVADNQNTDLNRNASEPRSETEKPNRERPGDVKEHNNEKAADARPYENLEINRRHLTEKNQSIHNQLKLTNESADRELTAASKERLNDKNTGLVSKKEINKRKNHDLDITANDVKRLISFIDNAVKPQDHLTNKTNGIREDHQRHDSSTKRGPVLPDTMRTLRESVEQINVKRFLEQEGINPRSLIETAKEHLRNSNKSGVRSNSPSANEKASAEQKDFLQRAETILEIPKAVRFTANTNDNTQNNGNSFNIQQQRADRFARPGDSVPAPMTRSESFMDNVQQMLHRSRVSVQDDKNGSFSVRLYPEKLGSVNVNIGLEQGVIHGKFIVENDEARDVLMQSMEQIKADLENAGISVGEFHVHVNDHRERFNTEQQADRSWMRQGNAADEPADVIENIYRPVHNGSIDMVI